MSLRHELRELLRAEVQGRQYIRSLKRLNRNVKRHGTAEALARHNARHPDHPVQQALPLSIFNSEGKPLRHR